MYSVSYVPGTTHTTSVESSIPTSCSERTDPITLSIDEQADYPTHMLMLLGKKFQSELAPLSLRYF